MGQELGQTRLRHNLDAVRVGQTLGVISVAAQRHDDALRNLRVRQSTEKLAHRSLADFPCAPLFALDGDPLGFLFQHEVDAAVWVSAAASRHCVAEVLVDSRDDLLELEPVDGSQPGHDVLSLWWAKNCRRRRSLQRIAAGIQTMTEDVTVGTAAGVQAVEQYSQSNSDAHDESNQRVESDVWNEHEGQDAERRQLGDRCGDVFGTPAVTHLNVQRNIGEHTTTVEQEGWRTGGNS